ncbi:ubiquitin-conjugating enzyme E2 27-like protein [Tanacetum coccineum]
MQTRALHTACVKFFFAWSAYIGRLHSDFVKVLMPLFDNSGLLYDYPYMPPKMRFTTKVWHPNNSIQTGIFNPASTDLRAKQYLTDHAAFTAIAWHWTKDFAMVSSAEYNRNSTRPSGSSESDIRINSSAHSFAPSCMPAIVRGQQEQLYPDVYKQNPMTKANIFGNADAIESTPATAINP